MKHPAAKVGLYCFMLMFVAFWTFVVGLFDAVVGYGFYNQIRSTQFETTSGKILTSQLIVEQGEESTIYRPEVTYEYSVDNKMLQGDLIRYGEISSTDSSAKMFVADHPVGKIVDVHFDPANVSDAVLVSGIRGPDLFILMFLTPFNVVMIGGWCVLGRLALDAITPRSLRRPCRYTDNGYELRITANRVSLLAVVGISLLTTSFASVFIVAIGGAIFSTAELSAFSTTLPVMLTVWAVILSVTALTTVRFAMRNRSGFYDIVVHRLEKKITLPIGNKRKQAVTLSFNDIEEVFVDKNKCIDIDGDQQEKFLVNLRLVEHSKSKSARRRNIELLTKFDAGDEDKAYRYANWFATNALNRKLALSSHDASKIHCSGTR